MADNPTPVGAEPAPTGPKPVVAPAVEPKTVDPTEARLAEILGAQKDLTEKVEAQDSLGGELRNLFAGLAQKIDGLSVAQAPPPAAPSATPGVAVTGPAVNTPEGWKEEIQKAVTSAMAPNVAANERIEKHRTSFQNVASKYPELNDASSRDAQIFNQIYRGREDLQRLDDAPSIIAEMTRGIRSRERAQERQIEQRKTQAATPASGGRGLEINPGADTEALKEQYIKLRDHGRKVPLTRREQGDFLNLTVALNHLGLL